jgi:lipopolysaccharide export system protein LptC
MSMSRIIYLILLFFVCWATYYLLDKKQNTDIQISPNLELPTFTGENFSNVSFSEIGIRNHIISSRHLYYYSKSGNTIFNQPILRVFQNGDVLEWKITAKRGILTKNNVLTLYDDVVAKNLLENSSFDSLSTIKMSIQLDTRDFWTEDPVLLKGPLFENQGQAIKGNFADHSALLYNNVQGRYETPKP